MSEASEHLAALVRNRLGSGARVARRRGSGRFTVEGRAGGVARDLHDAARCGGLALRAARGPVRGGLSRLRPRGLADERDGDRGRILARECGAARPAGAAAGAAHGGSALRPSLVYHLLFARAQPAASGSGARRRGGSSPIVESVLDVWKRPHDWYEREAFDLFGILFDGASRSLRRIPYRLRLRRASLPQGLPALRGRSRCATTRPGAGSCTNPCPSSRGRWCRR